MTYPNEPKQIKQGEDVHVIPGDNRVSVSGQVAVMSINGLLTKVIFDHNPTNEFFVEESFPLDWMYPHLTPFGNIMKINREEVPEFSTDVIKKDHEFWSRYSERFIGNWITYDTSVKDLAAFVEKVYLEHDYTGFKGDLRFIRDDVAQKSFSKLRSSIGGIYDWRFHHSRGEDQQRMLKEADFAFRQSFAFCPYSPEAVFRYVNLLLSVGRVEDAILVADACLKLDPNNGSVKGLVGQLNDIKNHNGGMTAAPQAQPTLDAKTIADMEKAAAASPSNFQAQFNLAGAYIQLKQNDKATKVLDTVFDSPNVPANAVVFLAQAYAQLGNYPKLEQALEKLTRVEPHSPEAWCDLAAMKIALNKKDEGMKDLRNSVQENSARLAQDPKASDILPLIRKDPRFATVRSTPEFEALVGKHK
jgi:tetratricopeptide (TPR) repeat protein